MKIIFLTSDLEENGGIQKFGGGLIEALKRNGHEVSVLALGKKLFFSKIVFVARLFLGFFTFRPAMIICGHVNFGPPAYFLKVFFGQDYSIIAYGIEAWEIKSRLKRKILKKAKLIVVISNFSKEKIVGQIPEVGDRIFYLPPFVDGKKFLMKEKPTHLLRKHGLSDSSKIILTVSRLSAAEQYKGYDKIIAALPGMIKETPNVKYFLIGKGSDSGRVRSLVESTQTSSFVVMIDRVSEEELVDYYNLSDVFVMPSKGEGFGMAFIEALACGRPVVAGNRDGSREAVLNGKLGILVDPDSGEDIVAAITGVLKGKCPTRLLDRDFLRKNVLDVFGFDKFVQKVENLVYELSR
ncbi:MAG: hypothetical protein UY23_C0001G0097 [Candidatus Jorgensenbacteria bacterium GW2011_GWA1_48_11]|uniref:Glycosyl transferase family 1 domain-containing protein n=1 Tax=Candidatus Jorgensenbacteria bacterium GW2011_GWA1_48_11 TaxID=1618660 RepID=A0A0G1UBF1_9BACT|nr:MAG: hypothetical protein UY23_C0001G0097 [Candidatus Jorgensenbacteria bacterium GW2011_GWA1_48_11]KKW11984.1 MAG: hypothetical protein UY51_C0005G0226 [Candidatus Jorgensenbacteria bacterium GW2011_GWB1_49_9]